MTAAGARPLVARNARTAELARTIDTFAVTALVAPAGYGKTSLLTLAFAERSSPAVRYTVERSQKRTRAPVTARDAWRHARPRADPPPAPGTRSTVTARAR